MIIAGTEPQVRRWTVEEYYRLWEAGFFIDERVELINGEILRMSPHNKPHSSAMGFLNNRLVRAFGETHLVRVQLPLSVGHLSEPEPDFSLVRPELIDGYPRHPTTADLVVEVSDSSLSYDRGRKASLYASAQVTEYWVLNIPESRLEVYREPRQDPHAEFGWSYFAHLILTRGQTVTPVAVSGEITVDQLFDWPGAPD